MATVSHKRIVTDRSVVKPVLSENQVSAKRLENVITEIAEDIRASEIRVSGDLMAQTDLMFVINTLVRYGTKSTVTGITKEKNRLLRRLKSKAMFEETLRNDGGVLSTTEAAGVLGKTKTTVNTWKNEGKLLAINIDGEFVYPVFQFTDDERLSDKGVLRGVHALLKQLGSFSDRMQYSFFMENRNTPLAGFNHATTTYTVAEVLKSNPSPLVMDELQRLARHYGSQDPL
jgi:hypothetical protein